MKSLLRIIAILAGAGILLFALIQLIPVKYTNPPVVTQIQWDSPRTEALFNRACADCHSNTTTWPWYSKVAPFSWLVVHDVNEGRGEFNVSNLSVSGERFSRLPRRMAEAVREGEMPPLQYTIIHRNAVLSQQEQQELIAGLQTTFSNPQSIK